MSKPKDHTGQKFGMLTAIKTTGASDKWGKRIWLFQCECGNKVERAPSNARTAAKRGPGSCGCCGTNNVNYTGQKFGMLTAIKASEKRGSSGSVYWIMKCDCGNIKEWIPSRIRKTAEDGFPGSCGCVSKLPRGIANRNRVLSGYKYAAKARDLEWNITDEQAYELFSHNCSYCGAEPRQCMRQGKNGTFIYSGIDRQDNSLGYILGNIVSCCEICNKMKMGRSIEDFLAHTARITEYAQETDSA